MKVWIREQHISFDFNPGNVFDFENVLLAAFDQEDVACFQNRITARSQIIGFTSEDAQHREAQRLADFGFSECFVCHGGTRLDDDFAQIGAHAEFFGEVCRVDAVRNQPPPNEVHVEQSADGDRNARGRQLKHTHRRKAVVLHHAADDNIARAYKRHRAGED